MKYFKQNTSFRDSIVLLLTVSFKQLQPKKKHIEYIKAPKSDSLAKVLGAYEEYYRLSFVNE